MRPIISAMRPIMLMMLLIVASGCSEDRRGLGNETEIARVACTQRPRNWPHVEPEFIGTGIEGLLFYEVEVRPNGSVRFNREEVDVATVQDYLRTADKLVPSHPVVLRTSSKSHCETAERIRDALDGLALCREGTCFESATWEALGFPTFKANEPAVRRH